MRKRPKTTGKSAKKSRRLAPGIIVALAILAIGAVTVISKVREGSVNQVKKAAPVSNAANRNYTTLKAAAQDAQVDGQPRQVKELTPEEAQRMAEALKQNLNRSTEGLVEVQQPDGSVSVDLEGRFQSVTVAKINEDGSVSQSCVDNARSAGAFFGIDPQLIENRPDRAEPGKKQPRVRPAKN